MKPIPQKHRWLRELGDSPESIGGRATDISQIAFTLENLVKSVFPINGVPSEIVEALTDLESTCRNVELEIESFLGIVERHANEE